MVYGILFSISFIISIIILVFLYRVRNVKIARLLIKMAVLVSFWLLMEMLSYYIKITEVAILFQKTKFVSVMFIPPLYFLAANEYADRKEKSFYWKILIFVIPVVSLLSMITDSIPYKFISDANISYFDGTPVFLFKENIGFWIHTFYSYVNILAASYIFMMRAVKSPILYRKQSFFVFAGSTITLVINILVVGVKIKPGYTDFMPICTLVTLIILYWGIFWMTKSLMIPIARELLVENIKDIAIVVDSFDKIIDINPAAVKFILMYGDKNKKINIEHGMNFIGIKIREVLEFIPNLKQNDTLLDSNNNCTLTFEFDGKTFYFQMYQSLIYDTDKSQIGRLFMLHDITLMVEHMNRLKHLNEELMISDRIISTAMEGVLITDASGNITRVNSSFERMSGYEEKDLAGKNPRILKSGRHDKEFYLAMWNALDTDGYWEGEIWDRRKNGEVYPKWMSITALKKSSGTIENYIAISTDISKIKKAEEAIHSLAYYDLLTGIPNRTLFYERLERALIRAKDNGKAVALFYMDLDRFKVINDSLGHAAGDLILKEVAARIKTCIRKSDTISRLGGDEFAVILEDIDEIEYVKGTAEGIIKEVLLPYDILDKEITLGISIGIALYPNDETAVEGLVRKADAAMYDAKEAGKGRYSFSSDEIEKRNHETLEMQIKLNKALANSEFKLYLQPQVTFTGKNFKVVGAEALIRWKTIDGKIFTPDKFIPMSENNGMIINIGNWIIEEILRIDKVLKSHGIDIKLAINVSSKQFENGSLVSKFKEVFKENSDQNINLVIEITESFLLQNLEKAIESLLEIKKLGIGIALDDFGTGFSSLSYLTRLPINYLKIDKSFIDDIAKPDYKNLTPNIISMAKILDLKTVAEGVETQDQINRLIEEECNQLQGYYFSKPLDIDDFVKYVKRCNLEQCK